MNLLTVTILSLPATTLIAAACLPGIWVNRHVAAIRHAITGIALIQFIVAISFAAVRLAGLGDFVFDACTQSSAIGSIIYYDGVASLMFALVAMVGWVICRYSLRYLDGEATQGRYLKWAAFTIGSVSLMVISGNLLMFVGAWVMTSLGLHQLLLHYGHRPAAKRAAWTKFTISRIGDVALMASIAIIFAEFKTLGFPQLFTAAESITTVTPAMVVASSLLVIGAITKSAQFPFHTWLPQTMETPTPVSALMHAGIVNAGGYLIIRTSPIVSLSPWALTCLAIIGGVTACFGAVVMLTQTSVKKTLAYSTIAQMGFMMLQCGLGAYSAAMLHILAHSLYKAHAFLSSGSVMSDRTAVAGCKSSTQPVSVIKLATVSAAIVGLLMLAFTILGVDAANKPGGLLLGGVLCLAMTQWVGQVMAVGDSRRVLGALAIAAGMCTAYVASFAVVDKIVAASLPPSTAPELGWLVVAVVTTGFVGMFVLQIQLRSSNHSARLATWRIHAANGFYVENMLRRVFGSLETN